MIVTTGAHFKEFLDSDDFWEGFYSIRDIVEVNDEPPGLMEVRGGFV